MNWERWHPAMICLSCRTGLLRQDAGLQCATCLRLYPIMDGVPHFLVPATNSDYATVYQKRLSDKGLRTLFSSQGLLSPTKFVNDRQGIGRRNLHGALERFLGRFSRDDLILDVGSGTRRLTPSMVNVDVAPFPNVDVVAGGDGLPFASGVVSGLVLQNVVELAGDPQSFIDESRRVLKSGGLFFIEAPFVFPRHTGPDNYRWTREGLAILCRELTEVESGVSMESGSALAAALFAFGDERFCGWPRVLRAFAYGGLGILCFLVRQLDVWPAVSDRRSLYAEGYFVGQKP